MIVAKWKTGFETMFKADPQKCAEEIRSIGDAPTTQQIVDAARDESTELHKCFEWRDDVAAEKYRLVQARYVTHMLVIQEQEPPKDRPEIRVFYKQPETGGYAETRKIVRDEDAYMSLLAQAWRELRAFKQKYGMLKELAEIMELID